VRTSGNFSFRCALKEFYDYSLFSTCTKKFLIFLRNDCDCMVVDPYKARKRYTVTESLDLTVSVK
jgi:hypothetical protein